MPLGSQELIELTKRHAAPNYAPLEVVIERGSGAWVWDVEGRRYLDMLSAYSAVNFGHCHPRIVARASEQLGKLTLTSRSFYFDQLAHLSKELSEFCGMESVLIMNSGAEAVETAVKAARRWVYSHRKVENERAKIVCFEGNFHGRTTTIISFSDSSEGRRNYGPYAPGFELVPFGDLDALERALDDSTVAVLFEPIQGEGGIVVPPDGYLRGIRKLCTERNVLMIADEIQTGLGRTGAKFACDHEKVVPDLYIIGKSLGGGITPISAVVGSREILALFTPGSHGSTFGGNPFACAIAREVLGLFQEERLDLRSEQLGRELLSAVEGIGSRHVKEVRGRGLFIGIEFHPEAGKAKKYCEALKERGVLCKDTRELTIRLAPPLIIEEADLAWGIERLAEVLT